MVMTLVENFKLDPDAGIERTHFLATEVRRYIEEHAVNPGLQDLAFFQKIWNATIGIGDARSQVLPAITGGFLQMNGYTRSRASDGGVENVGCYLTHGVGCFSGSGKKFVETDVGNLILFTGGNPELGFPLVGKALLQ